jgi:hypothetical protein
MKLQVKAFALTLGIIWAAMVFLYTWWLLVQTAYFNLDIPGGRVFLSGLYPLYRITPLGSILGLIYGFVDGMIIGAATAWLYNLISTKNQRNPLP